MDLEECFRRLQFGYCLWVGAGTSVQLARAGNASVPDWDALVNRLEAEAANSPPVGASLSLPERLEVVQRVLGRRKFQKALREHTLTALADAVISAATKRAALTDGTIIPDELRQLVKLGHAANPIVNFNVEHLTSTALVAGTPHAEKIFS
ncbi:MAG: hypothetical protein JWO86_759, partial [Myxococcaceae bacterium]|nr:hypothetical protein [Myxococcaceae bacterium]